MAGESGPGISNFRGIWIQLYILKIEKLNPLFFIAKFTIFYQFTNFLDQKNFTQNNLTWLVVTTSYLYFQGKKVHLDVFSRWVLEDQSVSY